MPQPGIRVRTRSDARFVTDASYRDSFNPGGFTLSPYSTFTRYEHMADSVLKEYDRGGRLLPKQVLHEQLLLQGVSLIPNHKSMALDEIIMTQGWFPPVSPNDLSALIPSLSAGVQSDLCREAFNSFTRQFPEEITLGNFLIELRDLPSLLPRLSGHIGKDVSGVFLASEFGWKPLLDDLRTLSTLLTAIDKRLEFLRATRGKPTRLGFYKRLPVNTPGSTLLPGLGGSGGLEYVPTSHGLTFRAGGTLLQNLKDLDTWQAYLRAFLGTTGLSNPAKIAWNAIPFSFVSEWFLDVGSRVERFNVQQATADWVVYNTSHSIAAVASGRLYHYNPSTYANPHRGMQLADVRMKRYFRGPGLPTDDLVFGVDGLSPKQLALTLAMLGS